VPAVKINDERPLYINELKESMDFVRTVVKRLVRLDNDVNTLHITVPIDLSSSSINALEYAIHLAKRIKAYVKVVHFYHPVVNEIDGNIFVDPNEEKERREKFESFISEISSRHASAVSDGVILDSEFLSGFTTEGLIQLSKDEDTQLIIMGATGNGKLSKKIFGSISTEIARRSECPVLLVPEAYQAFRFDRMGIALESSKMNKQDLRFISLLSDKIDTQLEVITVTDDAEDLVPWELELDNISNNKIIKGRYIYNEKVLEGLEEYVSEGVDLLIMTTKKRNVFESIFHKSVSRNMAINSKIPLLILHHKCTCEHGGACCRKFKEPLTTSDESDIN
jgi:nucleotide-binding universal stress UspA family protein